MDRAEFDALRQMVSGDYQPSYSATTPAPTENRVAEFNQSDVDAIRLAMNADNSGPGATSTESGKGMVDIGTGSMATSEFCDLNKLVASNTTGLESGFTFICP
ncbi:hypothetical protein [Desulfosarcina sp.]|uniref:hypothetical protein n=1 Tax=Desulfosarcina sp. TaxID=2027861 RepID=UPI0039707964